MYSAPYRNTGTDFALPRNRCIIVPVSTREHLFFIFVGDYSDVLHCCVPCETCGSQTAFPRVFVSKFKACNRDTDCTDDMSEGYVLVCVWDAASSYFPRSNAGEDIFTDGKYYDVRIWNLFGHFKPDSTSLPARFGKVLTMAMVAENEH